MASVSVTPSSDGSYASTRSNDFTDVDSDVPFTLDDLSISEARRKVSPTVQIRSTTGMTTRRGSGASGSTNRDELVQGQIVELARGTRVQLVKILGHGTFGNVWRVSRLDRKGNAVDTLALKVARCPPGEREQMCRFAESSLSKEIAMLEMCRGYRRIVQMIDHLDCSSQNNPDCHWMILMELADCSLSDYITHRLDAYASPSNFLLPSGVDSSKRAASDYQMDLHDLFADARDVSTKATLGVAGVDYSLIRETIRGCAMALQQYRLAAAVRGLKVVHGDIKFDNFLVRKGVIMLADFGLARSYDIADSNLNIQGSLGGTPGYMDPSMLKNNFVSEKADEYALGCMLWYMTYDGFVTQNLATGRHLQSYAKDLRGKTNSPDLLEAAIGLLDPISRSRWTVEILLTSPFLAAFVATPMQKALGILVAPQLVLVDPVSFKSVSQLPAYKVDGGYYEALDGSIASTINNITMATIYDNEQPTTLLQRFEKKAQAVRRAIDNILVSPEL